MATVSKLRSIQPKSVVTKKQPRKRRESAVIAEVRTAFSPGARLATSVGMVLGGFIPTASYVVCHRELSAAQGGHWLALLAIVVGGLIFSAKTVWQWGRTAFADPWKASGFVLLLEGVMVLSSVQALAYGALALLVGINGVATGCKLSKFSD